MLETYTISDLGVSLNTGDSVVFNTNNVDSCCKITHVAGTPVVSITRPGYYVVEFNATGYNTGAASTVDSSDGTFSFQLYNNSIAIPNAQARATSIADTAIANISFQTIVQVKPSCPMVNNNASLEVKFLGQAGTLLAGTLTVFRVN